MPRSEAACEQPSRRRRRRIRRVCECLFRPAPSTRLCVHFRILLWFMIWPAGRNAIWVLQPARTTRVRLCALTLCGIFNALHYAHIECIIIIIVLIDWRNDICEIIEEKG